MDAHACLRIDQHHFDAFVQHLRSALQEIGADRQVTTEIMAQVAPLGAVIVNTDAIR